MVVSNALAYSDETGQFMTIDAAQMLDNRVVPLTDARPVATEGTRMTVYSTALGEIELGSGSDIAMPAVAQTVPQLNQIMAGGFGAYAEFMGFHGVAYYFANAKIPFLPTPAFFPIDQRAVAFYAGDEVRFTGLADGAVVQIDSTPSACLVPATSSPSRWSRRLGARRGYRPPGE